MFPKQYYITNWIITVKLLKGCETTHLKCFAVATPKRGKPTDISNAKKYRVNTFPIIDYKVPRPDKYKETCKIRGVEL